MSKSLLSYAFFFLLLSSYHLCLAEYGVRFSQRQTYQRPHPCQIHRLQALRPNRRIESEGGVTEMWIQNDEQFRCAGVAVLRYTIHANSYIMPGYNNAPKLSYVVQGQGVYSVVVPGCPETYQSFQSRGEGAPDIDEHQKVQRVRQGDAVASPTGMVHWFYNDQQHPLVIVSIIDVHSSMNQLDDQIRKFYIGGNQQQEQQQVQQQEQQGQRGAYAGEEGQSFEQNNVWSGIDDQLLQDVLGVSRDVVERIKGRNVAQGHMVRATGGLRLVRPSAMEEEEERSRRSVTNGLEETLCTARLKQNIGNPSRADIYKPEAGYLSTVNGLDLPVLNLLQLSAKKGSLRRNAILAPHWNLNAHSVIYVIRGSARVQIVGNQQQNPVYNGQLQEGQVLFVPQNFAVVKQAGSEEFEWVEFKTIAVPTTQYLAGKTSPFRGLPLDLLASMYQISRHEAENLKYNRGQEIALLAPSFGTQGRASA